MLRRLAARILGLHGASEAFGAVLNSDRLEDPSLLSDLPKLTHLTVTIERGTGPPLAEIVAQTPGLIELCVDLKRPLSAEDFQAIRKLPRLRDLYLKVPDDEHFEECLREITAYQDVESISGDCMSLSPTMVRYLVAAPGYYRLDIGCHDPPDAALLERLARAQQSANVQELTGDMRSTDGLPLHLRFSDGPKTKLNPP